LLVQIAGFNFEKCHSVSLAPAHAHGNPS
jgi:hypothetical protein